MRITEFFDAMVAKLEANRHKGGWQNMSQKALLKRLRQETIELTKAIEDGSPSEILKEAADVANFCFMISDNARAELEEKK